jgi:hypothetical protein
MEVTMDDKAIVEKILDLLEKIDERLDNIEIQVSNSSPPAPQQNSKYINEAGDAVGVRYEDKPDVWLWDFDSKAVKRSFCKKCEAPIYWVRSKQGPAYDEATHPKGSKWLPVDSHGTCHFDTCKVMQQETEEVPF